MRFKNNMNLSQSALNERPKNTPMMMAAGRAIFFRVSVVGIMIASLPNCRKGRRE